MAWGFLGSLMGSVSAPLPWMLHTSRYLSRWVSELDTYIVVKPPSPREKKYIRGNSKRKQSQKQPPPPGQTYSFCFLRFCPRSFPSTSPPIRLVSTRTPINQPPPLILPCARGKSPTRRFSLSSPSVCTPYLIKPRPSSSPPSPTSLFPPCAHSASRPENV